MLSWCLEPGVLAICLQRRRWKQNYFGKRTNRTCSYLGGKVSEREFRDDSMVVDMNNWTESEAFY